MKKCSARLPITCSSCTVHCRLIYCPTRWSPKWSHASAQPTNKIKKMKETYKVTRSTSVGEKFNFHNGKWLYGDFGILFVCFHSCPAILRYFGGAGLAIPTMAEWPFSLHRNHCFTLRLFLVTQALFLVPGSTLLGRVAFFWGLAFCSTQHEAKVLEVSFNLLRTSVFVRSVRNKLHFKLTI